MEVVDQRIRRHCYQAGEYEQQLHKKIIKSISLPPSLPFSFSLSTKQLVPNSAAASKPRIRCQCDGYTVVLDPGVDPGEEQDDSVKETMKSRELAV